MDSTATYLPQGLEANDVSKTANSVEVPDEIVVFANSGASVKVTGNDPKKVHGGSDILEGTNNGAHADSGAASAKNAVADTDGANALADAFKNLNVNGKSDPKYDYTPLDSYRAPKFPSIAVSSAANDNANIEWHNQPNKVGARKPNDDPYGNGPALYGRPLNASATDFHHRAAPAAAGYPGYGGGAYGTFQPPMHGGYLPHGYDVFGVSPTLTEPPVANGAMGPNGGIATNGGAPAPGSRYAPHRNTSGPTDHNGVGLTLNPPNGNGAPYSPIPMSPSPLSLNPYAAHHMAMNGQYGAYMSAPGPGASANGAKTAEAPGSALGTSPGGAQSNVGHAGVPTANSAVAAAAARGYAPPGTQLINVSGMPYPVPGQGGYYDESAMYAAAGYAPPHLQHGGHGLHPNAAAVHPQYGMNVGPHPGTPQMGAYGAYITGPMVGVGSPGMVPIPGSIVPSTNGASAQNGAGGRGAGNGASAGGHGQGHGHAGHQGHPGGGPQLNGAPNGGAGGAPGLPGTGVLTIVNGLTLLNGVPQPNADGTGPSANNRKLGLYKTELCRSWEEKGTCRYGPKCQFAHGEDEVRKVARHPKYKTEICRTFWLSGSCPYGKRCCFIHTDAPSNPSMNPPVAQGGDPGGAGGPSTAPGAVPPAVLEGQATPTHTRSTSTASEANGEQPPSSLLARISAKREGEFSTTTPSPQGPPRLTPSSVRPDFAHNRHLSTDAAETFSAPTRPSHSHSASAHTLISSSFSPTASGVNGVPGRGYGAAAGGANGVDGNGNLTPGSYWGHKRSASGGSAANPNPPTPVPGSGPEAPLRSIYTLSSTA